MADYAELRRLASEIDRLGLWNEVDKEVQKRQLAKGGNIHIDKSKRGTFTAAAKSRGLGTQEFASRVLANKENYSPAMVRKANFARNAASWSHADGGVLNLPPLPPQSLPSQALPIPPLSQQPYACGGPLFFGDGGVVNRYDGETESTGQMQVAGQTSPQLGLSLNFNTSGYPSYGTGEILQPDTSKVQPTFPADYFAKNFFNADGTLPPFLNSSVPPLDKRIAATSDIERRLYELENSKLNPNGGWNAKEKRWYPHSSFEGGAETIGYGIKLSNGSHWADLVKSRAKGTSKGWLTDDEVEQAVAEMSNDYYDKAKKVYDKKFGEGEWDKLNFKQQSILTDYEYNVKGGLKKYPKLMEAARDGDIDAMLNQSKRYSGTKALTGRNNSIAADIDSLRTYYPVSTNVSY